VTAITDHNDCHTYAQWQRGDLVKEPIVVTVSKLALAGEQAGFSIEEMIDLLQVGLTVETLFRLIERRLEPPTPAPGSSRWVV
jgi:hypothetical protein